VTQKLRVGVLFGGQSGEHEVSLVSARAVMENLDPERYDVVPIGISKQGRWLSGSQSLAALTAAADPQRLPAGAERPAADVTAEEVPSPGAVVPASAAAPLAATLPPLDVVFPVLHGPMGEDGTVQGLFELAGVAYVGCGVLASAGGMDKAMMKAAFSAAGLPQLPYELRRRSEWQRAPEAVASGLERALRYPMFVKPANMGSSVGISKATDRASLEQGLRVAFGYDRRVVIEQGISAREIEISVLGNDQVEASVPGEVVPSNDWYDYEAKYLDGASQIIIPAPISEALTAAVRDLAEHAFLAIDGTGLARVDFLLDRDTDTLYLNEVNTMPGFTPVSMYAQMWAASGLSYARLLDRLIALALERRR
jgi:D-alanine-D-alanine ligase